MTKLTIADIADEMLKVFDLDDALGGLAMEQLHNRVKAQETDPEVATKMLNEGFLAALRKSNEKEFKLTLMALMACLFSGRAGSTAECRRPGRGQLGDAGEARDAPRTTEPGPVGPAPEYRPVTQ
jgi:hypothetical protein